MAGPIPHGGTVGITVDVSGAVAKLKSMSTGLSARDILDAIGNRELLWLGQNLDQAGKIEGGAPWQIMAPMTLRMRPGRQDDYHFSSPYQDLLRKSMVAEVNESGAYVSVGTNARYALDHQEGRPATNLPARKLLPTADTARRHSLEVVNGAIAAMLKSIG